MNDISKLRFWCHKILPLVYDDSLSYYEVLTKVQKKINELIDSNNSMPDLIDSTVKEELNRDDLANKLFNGLATAIAKDEGNATFTTNNKLGGELIWLNGTLYKVTAVMEPGQNYILGTNIAPVKLSNELSDIKKLYICSSNEGWNERASKAYNPNDHLFWKDGLYIVTKDIAVNDILYSDGDNQNIKQSTLGTEIASHYKEMQDTDINLQNQITGNDGDIDLLQKKNTDQDNTITSNYNQLNNRMNSITAQAGTDNTEIVDARVGAEKLGSTTYTTIGEAIRNQIGLSMNNYTMKQNADDMTDIGIAFWGTNDNIANLPSNVTAGCLIVFAQAGNAPTRLYQVVLPYNGNGFYIRNYTGTTWRDWTYYPLATTFMKYQHSFTNADALQETGMYVSTGQPTNVPNGGAIPYTILVYRGGGQIIQHCYALNDAYQLVEWTRELLQTTWTPWCSTSTTGEVVKNANDISYSGIHYHGTSDDPATNVPAGYEKLPFMLVSFFEGASLYHQYQVCCTSPDGKVFIRNYRYPDGWSNWDELTGQQAPADVTVTKTDDNNYNVAFGRYNARIRHVIDESINEDSYNIIYVNQSNTTVIPTGTDIIGPIQETGQNDFQGGVHGDEKIVSVSLTLDGNDLTTRSAGTTTEGSTLVMSFYSHLYRPADHTTNTVDRFVTVTIKKNTIHVSNTFKILENNFSVHRATNGGLFAIRNPILKRIQLNTNSYSTPPTSQQAAVTRSRYNTSGTMWWTNGSVTLRNIIGHERDGYAGYLNVFTNENPIRSKIYFDNVTDKVMNSGDIIPGEFEYIFE